MSLAGLAAARGVTLKVLSTTVASRNDGTEVESIDEGAAPDCYDAVLEDGKTELIRRLWGDESPATLLATVADITAAIAENAVVEVDDVRGGPFDGQRYRVAERRVVQFGSGSDHLTLGLVRTSSERGAVAP